ncbi:similar to Saccharomyces cerevisiae YOR149C SMP3 Alpha 1,2-mannosyltransferase involved in glycosyl phosphatidyl inositol (GPI) biosynthesis [Maudiozyma barnettii]|uniref:Mannosyltransferase n=1 Tax=Maudiozyma barnettii TaxID=61262 RepID=A0A8H2VDW6_9SACH|nr:glycosylphosphatidylinositol-alpha 1,2 mannosyltransferase [Kazachstania barnettii]CAB4253726.1 similar to Saccharomyces cerevisiae YOR149C SMP3 Alpha 1,2-mannosyltransferase involved in glycosyl phosphatidyl inositol (GPI) biosynthesis [Kazachstania barnettii]CAD1781474.1 similar to Saccharomyces cerevisiae YOR149C SMP3 Alpha 1,2-mannosyltransferase involved in glycosyl phosphatidyl inositol (GPI) biosynthesis [Kazachstania barnettii]
MHLSKFEILAISIGILIAIQPSYIHPDEHFQSLEILAQLFYGINGTIPWEYDLINGARSFVPLILYYGPVYYLLACILHINNPSILLYCVRLQHALSFLLITYMSLSYIVPNSKACRSKAYVYVITSYVTWSFQSHSFSNSIETLVLLATIATFSMQLEKSTQNYYLLSIFQGILITLGIFNRMTFPAFVFLPSLMVFWKYYLNHWRSFMLLILTIVVTSFIFILIDTNIYGSSIYIIAPMNNLLYNVSVDNLSQHGLHPRYTHILVNLPQLIGPGILYMIPHHKNQIKSFFMSLPMLSIYSAILILSLFPHQELRFLTPLVPFICIKLAKCKSPIFFKIWVMFNLTMGIIIGVFHQSGIVDILTQQIFYADRDINVHIWWKSYSPPTWMYMNDNLTVSTTNFIDDIERIDNIDFNMHENYVIDLKGSDLKLTNETIWNFMKNDAMRKITLFYPSSVESKVLQILNNTHIQHKKIYHTRRHLDLDHFDINDLSTFIPGFSVVELQYA